MSRKKSWQICHKNIPNNQDLTRIIVSELRKHKFMPKQVAHDLNLSMERTRNWYYKNIGVTGRDVILLILHYDFIEQAIFTRLGVFKGEDNSD